MPKNQFLIDLQKKHLREIADAEFKARKFSRTFTMDIVTIALGRYGFTPEDLEKFRDIYIETEQDFCDEVLTDYYNTEAKYEERKKIDVAKHHIDETIKQYVPEEMFVPFDERYNNE